MFYFIEVYNRDTGEREVIPVDAKNNDDAIEEAVDIVSRWGKTKVIPNAGPNNFVQIQDEVVELDEPWGWTNVDYTVLGYQKTADVIEDDKYDDYHVEDDSPTITGYDWFGNPLYDEEEEQKEEEQEQGGFRLF